jgi:hypothetical protein
MMVALVLVVVLMQQARKPGVYQTFFPADPAAAREGWTQIDAAGQVVGDAPNERPPTLSQLDPNLAERAREMPSEDEPNAAAEQNGAAAERAAAERAAAEVADRQRASRNAADVGKVVVAWAEPMERGLQRFWIQRLVGWKYDRPIASTPLVSEETSETESASDDEKPGRASAAQAEQSVSWLNNVSTAGDESMLEAIDAIRADLKRFFESADAEQVTWGEIAWWGEPFLAALDQQVLDRVADGTFWTGTDRDAFELQLITADELPTEEIPVVGTLPLLQQPDVYRGKPIRLVGRLGMAIRKETESTYLSIDHFWNLWMVPEDGGIRPVLLVVRELPESLQSRLDDQGRWQRDGSSDGPDGRVTAVGRFLKRLPYRSEVGADLAPVVVGRITAFADGRATPTTGSEASRRPDALTRYRWLGLVVAVLAGVAIAVGLMKRSFNDEKRARRLRQKASSANPVRFDSLHQSDAQAEGRVSADEEPNKENR